MIAYETFHANWRSLEERIAKACGACGRDSNSVSILPVTKNHPAAAVEYASRAGARAIGENRVQEAEGKRREVQIPMQWELIGHLQSNKARVAAGLFDRIQSVGSLKLIGKLGQVASERPHPLRILLQVNAGEDPAKFGCAADEAPALLEAAMLQPGLCVEGLMTIAPLSGNIETARKTFARLREIRDSLRTRLGLELNELSMGMTDDLEAAIAEGSTQIRVGTALFGQRA